MSTPANVHSLEAIDGLRGALVSFIFQIRDALTELDVEMRRMLEWLEHDRPKHWKGQLRNSINQVHEAQQALNRCLMFPIADERPACSEERAALKKAQARQHYCEEKMERVRRWQRNVEHELFDYQGRISRLVRLIEVEVPEAIAVLQKIVQRLEDYQSVRAADPTDAYNDVSLAEDIWPDKRTGAENPSAHADEHDTSLDTSGSLGAGPTPECPQSEAQRSQRNIQ